VPTDAFAIGHWELSASDGAEQMKTIGGYIREGSDAYVMVVDVAFGQQRPVPSIRAVQEPVTEPVMETVEKIVDVPVNTQVEDPPIQTIGTLRDLEIEQLVDSGPGFVADTILFLVFYALTIDNKEVGTVYFQYICCVIFMKVFHLVTQTGVSHMFEVGVPRLIVNIKLVAVMGLLFIIDVLALQYFYSGASRSSTFFTWILFEALTMLTVVLVSICKYSVHMVDLRLDNGWPGKSVCLFYIGFVHDVVSMTLFLVFMPTFFVQNPSRLPIYMIADVIQVARKLAQRLHSFRRYRRISNNMEARFADSDYGACVAIVSHAAIHDSSSMTGMLVALFLNSSGGVWDNAKRLVESGGHCGTRTDANKAPVTGDMIAALCNDTAALSLHVLRRLIATARMVVGPVITVPCMLVDSRFAIFITALSPVLRFGHFTVAASMLFMVIGLFSDAGRLDFGTPLASYAGCSTCTDAFTRGARNGICLSGLELRTRLSAYTAHRFGDLDNPNMDVGVGRGNDYSIPLDLSALHVLGDRADRPKFWISDDTLYDARPSTRWGSMPSPSVWVDAYAITCAWPGQHVLQGAVVRDRASSSSDSVSAAFRLDDAAFRASLPGPPVGPDAWFGLGPLPAVQHCSHLLQKRLTT